MRKITLNASAFGRYLNGSEGNRTTSEMQISEINGTLEARAVVRESKPSSRECLDRALFTKWACRVARDMLGRSGSEGGAREFILNLIETCPLQNITKVNIGEVRRRGAFQCGRTGAVHSCSMVHTTTPFSYHQRANIRDKIPRFALLSFLKVSFKLRK